MLRSDSSAGFCRQLSALAGKLSLTKAVLALNRATLNRAENPIGGRSSRIEITRQNIYLAELLDVDVTSLTPNDLRTIDVKLNKIELLVPLFESHRAQKEKIRVN